MKNCCLELTVVLFAILIYPHSLLAQEDYLPLIRDAISQTFSKFETGRFKCTFRETIDGKLAHEGTAKTHWKGSRCYFELNFTRPAIQYPKPTEDARDQVFAKFLLLDDDLYAYWPTDGGGVTFRKGIRWINDPALDFSPDRILRSCCVYINSPLISWLAAPPSASSFTYSLGSRLISNDVVEVTKTYFSSSDTRPRPVTPERAIMTFSLKQGGLPLAYRRTPPEPLRKPGSGNLADALFVQEWIWGLDKSGIPVPKEIRNRQHPDNQVGAAPRYTYDVVFLEYEHAPDLTESDLSPDILQVPKGTPVSDGTNRPLRWPPWEKSKFTPPPSPRNATQDDLDRLIQSLKSRIHKKR